MCPHGLVDLNDSSPRETAPPMYSFEKYLLSRHVLDEGVRAGNKRHSPGHALFSLNIIRLIFGHIV